MNTCQFEIIIRARVPQFKYSDGTVEELTTPGADRYSQVTTLLAGFAIKLLEACPTTQAVCTLTRLSWSTVNAIMLSAVERGVPHHTKEEIAYLGIDEKSSERGHTYASILTYIDRSRVLYLVPERKLVAPVSLLETLTPAQRTPVKAVAMWTAYMSATRRCLPQADIVHDKFHICKYLVGAVDAVRKQEHRKLSKAGTSSLKGRKWAWLRKYPDGRSAEAVSFRASNQLNLKTSQAWRIKEKFQPVLELRLQRCCQTVLQNLVEQRDAQQVGAGQKGRQDAQTSRGRVTQLQPAKNQQRLCRRLQQCHPTHQG